MELGMALEISMVYGDWNGLGAQHGLWSLAWSWSLTWSMELGMVFDYLAWSLVARHGLENWCLLQVMYLIFYNHLEDEIFRD